MTLIQDLNREKNRIGLVSGNLKINEYDDAEQNVSAHINPKNWNIEITMKKNFNPINDRRQKAYARKKKIEDGRKKLLEDVLAHELAHWELPFSSGYGCPFDPYNHDKITEAVKEALPEDKKAQAGYVANAFEDLIINPRCREFKGDFSGQVLFWDDQGFQCRKQGRESYTPFYEAFVKLNMHLFGDNSDKALLKRHYSNDKKVEKATKKTIQDLSLQENIQDTYPLFAKGQWPNMASAFAKNLADLLETKPTEKLSAHSDNGNGVEQKAATREGKEEIAYGRYKGNGGLSPNMAPHEQLDSLYRKLARAIPVKVEAITREQDLAIAPLNFRPFDEEKDDIRKIKPTKLFFTDNGITFGYGNQQLSVTQKSKIQKRSFPNFKMVVLDNSGSMAEGIDGNRGDTSFIPWGDNSKYHYALLGFYGIENFLQLQGIAQYIGHGLSLFSSSTRYQESDFKDLQRLRKLALSPEFGSTRLDAGALLNALKGRESFVLSLSDGEIANWDKAKDEFYRLAGNNYFAHIQIGGKNEFTENLESKKFPVLYVSSGDELSRLMVNVANDTYRRFTRE
ncbi:hypothetical protein HYV89_00565 [Candidatus Woesearchaeota archaeon]|nr:hypothetical protein [Candidatus Woesearchaeota archaeon]